MQQGIKEWLALATTHRVKFLRLNPSTTVDATLLVPDVVTGIPCEGFMDVIYTMILSAVVGRCLEHDYLLPQIAQTANGFFTSDDCTARGHPIIADPQLYDVLHQALLLDKKYEEAEVLSEVKLTRIYQYSLKCARPEGGMAFTLDYSVTVKPPRMGKGRVRPYADLAIASECVWQHLVSRWPAQPFT